MAQEPLNPKPNMGGVPLQPMPQAVQPPQQVIAAPQAALGPEPCSMTCPSCGASVMTSVVAKPSTMTHLLAMCLCCIGCILCFWCPYCIDSCQNADHICPNCDAYLGTYTR